MKGDFKNFLKEYSLLVKSARRPFLSREYKVSKYLIILGLCFFVFESVFVYFLIPVDNDMDINVLYGKILFPIAFVVGSILLFLTIKYKKYFVYFGTVFVVLMGFVQILVNISSTLFLILIILSVSNLIFMRVLGTDDQQ